MRGVKARNNRLLVERPSPRDGSAGETPRAGGQKRIRRLPRSVTVNLAESPLGWLLAHGQITDRQYAAGEQLRADWERAELPPRVTFDWDAPLAKSGGRMEPAEPTARQLAARRRFDAAAAAAGPGLRDILWRIVCAGENMREAERALDWPARAGKLVLRLALDRLAAHYRLR